LETNFGCVGPGSDTALVIVPVGPPTNIFGSSSVIMLDTCIYNVSGIANANYFWTCNNANIIQNNNHECKIIFPSTGTYQLKCNYGATCDSVILVKNIYVSSGLGMDDFLNQSGIALMNNISEGIFQIFSNRNNGSVFLSVYQIDGKLVTHRLTYPITVDSAYNLDLSSLKSGVYYLKIDIDNLSKTFKIVKI
jgi:hypothetical protein